MPRPARYCTSMAALTCRSRRPSNRTAQPQRLSLSVVTTDRRGYYPVMTRTAAIALLALLTATPSWGQASVGQSCDRAEAATPVAQSSSEKVRDNPANQYILVKTVVGKVIGTIDVRALPVEPEGYNLLKYCWTPSNVLGDWAERAGLTGAMIVRALETTAWARDLVRAGYAAGPVNEAIGRYEAKLVAAGFTDAARDRALEGIRATPVGTRPTRPSTP